MQTLEYRHHQHVAEPRADADGRRRKLPRRDRAPRSRRSELARHRGSQPRHDLLALRVAGRAARGDRMQRGEARGAGAPDERIARRATVRTARPQQAAARRCASSACRSCGSTPIRCSRPLAAAPASPTSATTAFAIRFERLVTSLETEAQLTILGRMIARRDLLRLLESRLRHVDLRKQHREIECGAHRAAALHSRHAAHRHLDPPRADGAGSAEPRADVVGGDVPVPAAGGRELRQRSAHRAGRRAPLGRRQADPRLQEDAPDGRAASAGMRRDHAVRVRVDDLAHQQSRAELRELVREHRPAPRSTSRTSASSRCCSGRRRRSAGC